MDEPNWFEAQASQRPRTLPLQLGDRKATNRAGNLVRSPAGMWPALPRRTRLYLKLFGRGPLLRYLLWDDGAVVVDPFPTPRASSSSSRQSSDTSRNPATELERTRKPVLSRWAVQIPEVPRQLPAGKLRPSPESQEKDWQMMLRCAPALIPCRSYLAMEIWRPTGTAPCG